MRTQLRDHDFQKYRDIASTPEFGNARHALRGEIVNTRGLQMVISGLKQLQQQMVGAFDDGTFWNGCNRIPLQGLAIIGESGSGKSFCLKTAQGYLDDIELPDGSTIPTKSLLVETPSYASMGTLAREIIRRADGVAPRIPKDDDAQTKVTAAFERHRYTTVILDELTRMLSRNRYAARTLAVQSHLFWSLAIETLDLNVCPTPVVVSGLPFLLDTWNLVDRKQEENEVRWEAKRRFDVMPLPNIDLDLDSDLLHETIQAYCHKLGVTNILKAEDLVALRLCHASNRQVGDALKLAQDAVAMAKVRPRGRLQLADFAIAYTLRAGGVLAANPFAVTDFERIDITKNAAATGAAARKEEIA